MRDVSMATHVHTHIQGAWQACGPIPMSPVDSERWEAELGTFRDDVAKINKKVRIQGSRRGS